jgi:drug/metabolite transporter (DMT)-like permease
MAGYLTVNKHIYANYDITAFQYSMFFAIMGAVFAFISLVHKWDGESLATIRSNLRSFIVLAIAGFLAVSIFTFGLNFTSTVNAALLITTSIVATSLFSHLILGERYAKNQWLWVAVLFAGLYIAIVGFHRIHLQTGDLIVLASVLFFGFGNAFSRKVMGGLKRPGIAPDSRLVLGALIAVAILAVTQRSYSIFIDILPLGLLAGFFYWACMKAFARCVHLLNANEAIVLNNTQIFFTSIAGVLLLSEAYSLEKFLGSLIVIIGVYFISARQRLGRLRN